MNCGHASVPLAAFSCLRILGVHREEECPSSQQFYRPIPPFMFPFPNQVSVFTCHEWTMELGDRGRWWYTRCMVVCLHCSDSDWSWLVLCRLLIPPPHISPTPDPERRNQEELFPVAAWPAWLSQLVQPAGQRDSNANAACCLVFWRLSVEASEGWTLCGIWRLNLFSPWCPLSKPLYGLASFSGTEDKQKKSHYSARAIGMAVSFEPPGKTLLALELYIILDPLRVIIYLTGYL